MKFQSCYVVAQVSSYGQLAENFRVCVTLENGTRMVHESIFEDDFERAQRFVAKVCSKHTINPEHWIEYFAAPNDGKEF